MSPRLTPTHIFEQTLGLITELTAISSPSGDLGGLEAAARCLGSALESRGLEVEIRPRLGEGQSEQPVLYARGKRAEETPLLLIGHLDTVLAAIPPERRGDRLLATGVIDMKGGLATLVGALDLLAAQGKRAVDDLLLVVVPDEEVAGVLSHRVLKEEGPKARGLLVLEPGQPWSDGAAVGETVVLGRRGMFQWRLDVTGRGAHAGNAYWQGRSALLAAAEWALAARALARPGQGPTVNPGRLIAGETSFVDDLANAADLVGTSRQINVVPNRALVEGEARFLEADTGTELVAAMSAAARRIATEHDVAIEFTSGDPVPPLDPNGPGRALARQAVALAAEAGWRLEVEEDRGGISFPNFLPDPSTIPILDGLGPVGGGMHTRDEFLDLASLDRRIPLLAGLLTAD